MHLVRVRVWNFRGIADGEILLSGHTVFVGANNAGKSTLLEAVDLVLDPERLNRRPVVDEHDFYAGMYVDHAKKEVVPIQIEVIVAGLSEEQQQHFRDHIEWWDANAKALLKGPPPEGTDAPHVGAAMRVFFNGWYDVGEDDFSGDTYYAIQEMADGAYVRFSTPDKQVGHERRQLLTPDLLAKNQIAALIDAMNLEHILGQVDSNCRNLHCGRLHCFGG